MSLLKFLGLAAERTDLSTPHEVESIRRISKQLEEMEPEKARYIAAFAYLLGRVAQADRNISPEEAGEMEQIVMEIGQIPHEQAVMIVEIAKRQNRLFGHVENFLVTREFNELATKEQKMRLLDCLFAVSSSDRTVSSIEDREIRQISSELQLSHREFIDVRSKYRNFLGFLKTPETDA